MGLFDSWDDIFEKDFAKFDEYSDLERIDELVDMLKGLRGNQKYTELSLISSKNVNKTGKPWRFYEEKIPFINAAKKGFGLRPPLYIYPITKFLNFIFFQTLYSIIQFSYVLHSGELLGHREYKSIILGDLGPSLTYFVEDYDKSKKLPEPSIDFFKRLKNVKWHDKKAHNLEKLIYNRYITHVTAELDTPSIFQRTSGFAASYLIGCNALKNDRNRMTYEDVIAGYLTTFKVMLNDVRPLVPFVDEKKEIED